MKQRKRLKRGSALQISLILFLTLTSFIFSCGQLTVVAVHLAKQEELLAKERLSQILFVRYVREQVEQGTLTDGSFGTSGATMDYDVSDDTDTVTVTCRVEDEEESYTFGFVMDKASLNLRSFDING